MEQLLTEKEAADRLRIGHTTLKRLRQEGRGPQHIRIGGERGHIRYTVEALEAWVRKREVAC